MFFRVLHSLHRELKHSQAYACYRTTFHTTSNSESLNHFLFGLICCILLFYIPNPCILGTRPVSPCRNGYCCKLELVRAKSFLVPIALPLVVHRQNYHTCNFDSCCAYRSGEIHLYGYSSVASASFGYWYSLYTVVLEIARAFMPASLVVISYTILEVSEFLGQLLVGKNDDEKSRFIQNMVSVIEGFHCNTKPFIMHLDVLWYGAHIYHTSVAEVDLKVYDLCVCHVLQVLD